jgi:rhamnosyltransferase subunit B
MTHAILSAFGSLGDVHPMLAIGRRLLGRGYRVTVLLAEPYVEMAQQMGLQPHVLIAAEEFQQMIQDPDLWRPIEGVRLLMRRAAQRLDAHYEQLEALVVDESTVLVAHPLDFAARIFRDRHPHVPLASVHLAPATLRVPKAPPRLMAQGWIPRWPSKWMELVYRVADRWLVDRHLTPAINTLRGKLQMASVDRPLHRWWLSPDLVLGLFPEWFSPPLKYLPKTMRLVGFPLADGSNPQQSLDRSLMEAVKPKPLVFTAGSENAQARAFFAAACQACRELQLPGLLLTGRSDQLPESLPESVRHMTYAPFSRLLPGCRAIIHHGGIGTTSQGLAAGIPQLILPMAFDQFDNAHRATKLGCARWWPMRKLSPRRLTDSIGQLLETPFCADAARWIANRFAIGDDAAGLAADQIDALRQRFD